MGGQNAEPVVTRFVRDWGAVILICTDGLTKHVSDELIEQRLSSMQNARETAELLLQDALDGGGTDNITVITGRTVRPPEA
jgi:protein phosphatase